MTTPAEERAVYGPYHPLDLDKLTACPGCGWKGPVKATVWVPDGPAECPECGRQVEAVQWR